MTKIERVQGRLLPEGSIMADRGYGIGDNLTPEHQGWLDRAWTDRGQIPPWRRVIAAGQDVTDQPVQSWPPTYQRWWAAGWRPWLTLPDGTAPRLPTIPGTAGNDE